MEETPHHVWLTEDQLQAVRSVFEEKGWTLNVETDELFKRRQEAADDYVTLANERISPTSDSDELFKRRQEAADDYVTLANERISPTSDSDELFKRRHEAADDYVTLANERLSPTSDSDRFSPIQLRPKSIKINGDNGKTYTLDRSQKDLQQMKQVGSSFKKSVKSQPKTSKSKSPDRQHNNWRLSKLTQSTDEEDIVDSDVNFTHFVLPNDNTIKILTKLSTEHVQNVSRVPVRIVLLVDRSGSMLHKLGRDGRHPKITKVKHFVDKLIQTLDEGDEVALVTFGEDADVLFPLVKLDRTSRDSLRGTLRSLDKGSMSRVTNLSVGLRRALKVFYDATKNNADYLLSSKNSILVFTDGDINSGTTNTNDLVHEVRQNIRQMVPSLDETQSQWVTISVVNTGSSVSEQAYTLSKTCSSDAYYYIDNAAEDPEAELFLPVLLRKTAVAWNISYVIEAFHDIELIKAKCSKDNRVRLRRSVSRKQEREERSYFLYDIPAGATREFGVYASWGGLDQMGDIGDDAVLFKMRVEFTNIKGERYWQEVTVTKGDISEALKATNNVEASQAAFKHEMKLISGDVLRTAAELLKTGEKRRSQAVIQEGQRDLQALMNSFGEKSREESDRKPQENVLVDYAKCVVDNMNSLIETIESASQGAAWNKVKAVSTAIVRETPNTTESLVDGNILCPFPSIDHMETGGLKGPLERMQAKNKANKRITFGNLDTLLENELR